jgi:hypothetical protein
MGLIIRDEGAFGNQLVTTDDGGTKMADEQRFGKFRGD